MQFADRGEHSGRSKSGTTGRIRVNDGHRAAGLRYSPGDAEPDHAAADDGYVDRTLCAPLTHGLHRGRAEAL